MAIDQRTLPANIQTDADFRAWGSGISAQFAAIGLIKTADTGQINWTTVLKPASSTTMQGYEIWRFNDALQASKPVFFKIEFGSGGIATAPGLTIQAGTASNGAGALSGSQIGNKVVNLNKSSVPAVGVVMPSYCSGSPSRLILATDSNTADATYLKLIVIERPRTSAGVDTGDGIVTMYSSANGAQFQVVPFSGAVPTQISTFPYIDPTNLGTSSLGTDAALVPGLIMAAGKLEWASMLVYKSPDIPGASEAIFSVDFLGATRTYMTLGLSGMNRSNNAYPGNATCALAIPWS